MEASPSLYDNPEAKARIVKEAMSAKLPDAAFMIFMFNVRHLRSHSPFYPIDPRTVLKGHFPDSEIADACRRADALLKDAYKAGDDALSHRFSSAEIAARMEAKHPGFSYKSYHDTLDNGCFLACW